MHVSVFVYGWMPPLKVMTHNVEESEPVFRCGVYTSNPAVHGRAPRVLDLEPLSGDIRPGGLDF